MAQDKQCSTCRFFKVVYANQTGECRLNPPNVEMQVKVNSAGWATVGPADWCGQWAKQTQGAKQ